MDVYGGLFEGFDEGLADALIVEREWLSDLALIGPTAEAWHDELARYEQWVKDSYPDRYAALFHEPCCEVKFVMLPENIAHHVELMDEYLGL